MIAAAPTIHPELVEVARSIGGDIECLGGNVQGVVTHLWVDGTKFEVIVTADDGWVVGRCDDPDGLDPDHDHAVEDASIGPLDDVEAVRAAFDQLVAAVTR